MAPSINRTDQGLRLWYSFPKGTTYLLAQVDTWNQWTIIVLQVASEKNVRYSVDEYIPWTNFTGKILGPLVTDTVEQILSESILSGSSGIPEEDLLTMNNWYAFWLPESIRKARVAVYYDPSRWPKRIEEKYHG